MTYRFHLALGANLSIPDKGLQTDLLGSMRHGASRFIQSGGFKVLARSGLYETAPLGCPGRQPRYLNAVLLLEGALPPAELLRLCKRIEKEAGRRQRGVNAARPLDLDIIDMSGRILGWPMKALTSRRPSRGRQKRRSWLTLPHPEMHRRRFVLEPLAEITPHWRHPVLNATACQLLHRLPKPPGQIRRVLDSKWLSCDKLNENRLRSQSL